MRQPVSELPPAFEQRLEEVSSLLVGRARECNVTDVVCPSLQISLLRRLLRRGPRHDRLRRADKGQQCLTTTDTDRLVIGDLLGLSERVPRLLKATVALDKRLDRKIRQPLPLATGNPEAK